MTELTEHAIVRALAEHTCRRIARKTILSLQAINMEEALQSSKESGLKNTWDEICAQFQDEFWLCWDVYELTIRSIVEAEVEELQSHEREAIWMQTKEGKVWESEDEGDREPYPVCRDDVVEYLMRTYIFAEADRWTNKRIRAYLDRSSLRD